MIIHTCLDGTSYISFSDSRQDYLKYAYIYLGYTYFNLNIIQLSLLKFINNPSKWFLTSQSTIQISLYLLEHITMH